MAQNREPKTNVLLNHQLLHPNTVKMAMKCTQPLNINLFLTWNAVEGEFISVFCFRLIKTLRQHCGKLACTRVAPGNSFVT